MLEEERVEPSPELLPFSTFQDSVDERFCDREEADVTLKVTMVAKQRRTVIYTIHLQVTE